MPHVASILFQLPLLSASPPTFFPPVRYHPCTTPPMRVSGLREDCARLASKFWRWSDAVVSIRF